VFFIGKRLRTVQLILSLKSLPHRSCVVTRCTSITDFSTLNVRTGLIYKEGNITMLPSHLHALLLAPLTVQAVRIVLSNDDGWAEKNIRVLYDSLTASSQNVVISAPAENKSGTGALI
jgi:hypothetical protein